MYSWSRISKIVPFQTKDLVALVTMDELYWSRGKCMCGLGFTDLLYVEEIGGVLQGILLDKAKMHKLHYITSLQKNTK